MVFVIVLLALTLDEVPPVVLYLPIHLSWLQDLLRVIFVYGVSREKDCWE
jgi:hypothetical protein